MRIGTAQRENSRLRLNIAWWILVVAVILPAGACAKRYATDEDLRLATLEAHWSTLQQDYPYFHESGVDWREARSRREGAILNAPTPGLFHRQLNLLFAELQDPHISLNGGTKRWPEHKEHEELVVPGVGVMRIGRDLCVWSWPRNASLENEAGETVPGRPEDACGVLPKIEMVDGERAWWHSLPAALSGRATDDAHLVVLGSAGEHMRVRCPRRDEFEIDQNDRMDLTTYTVHPPLMEGTPLEWRWPAAEEFYIRRHGEQASAAAGEPGAADAPIVYRNRLGVWPMGGERPKMDAKGGVGAWALAVREGDAAYMRISTMNPENVNGFDGSLWAHHRLVDEFDRLADSIAGAESVIIDLRYNAGGDSWVVGKMMGRFLDSPVLLKGRPQDRVFGLVSVVSEVSAWPRRPRAGRRFAVLVNEQTGSCAEILAAVLRMRCDAVLVGTPTAGAEAGVARSKGPDGSVLSFGREVMLTPGMPRFQFTGLSPDVKVEATIDRAREVGYTEMMREVERRQFTEACRAVDVDPAVFLRAPEASGQR